MATSRAAKRPAKGRKAKSKAANGPAQGPIGNTGGVFVPVPKPNAAGSTTKIPIVPETEEEEGFLEKKQGQLQSQIDEWVAAQGDSKMAMGAGALATALNQVFFPTSVFELVPVGKLFKLAKKAKQTAEEAIKAKKAERAKKAEDKAKDAKGAGDTSGGRVDGDGGGRCKLRSHKELTDKNSPYKCPAGMDSHHVVANRAFQTAKGRKGNLMKGGIPEDDGLAICLETNKNGPTSEHVIAHHEYDAAEKLLAKDPGSPEGLAKLGQLEKKAGDSIEKATGGKCRSEDIERQLREHHQSKFKLGKGTFVRANKNARGLTKGMTSSMGKSGWGR
jgi:hypothetical protein